MKSLINPFSVLRHLDFWSVVAFDTGGDAGGGGGDTADAGLSGQAAAEASVGLDAFGGTGADVGADVGLDAFGGIGADVGTSSGADVGIGYGAGQVDPGLADAAGIGGSSAGAGIGDVGDVGDVGGYGGYGSGELGEFGGMESDAGIGDVGLDAFGGPGADVGDIGADVGLDAFGGIGPDVGVDADVGLDAFGGIGPDVGLEADVGIGYGTGLVDPGLAAGIPDTADSVADLSAGTITNDPISSFGTGTSTESANVSVDPLGIGIVSAVDTGTFSDAFGNTYGTEVEASVADSIAQAEAAVANIGLDKSDETAETFSDAFGNQYGTAAEAAEADAVAEGLNAAAVESVGLSYGPTAGTLAGRDLDADMFTGSNMFSRESTTTPSMTGLEMAETNMVDDFMDTLDPFSRSEVALDTSAYYNSGPGMPGYNTEDSIADNVDVDSYMSAIDEASDDMNALDSIAEDTDLATGINLSDEDTVMSQPVTVDPSTTNLSTTTTTTAVAPDLDAAIASLQDQIAPTVAENIATNVVSTLASAITGLPVGGLLGKQMSKMSVEARQDLADSHIAALNNGATAVMDDDGNYVGYDTSTMSSFADEALADIDSVMPGSTMSDEAFDSFQTQFGTQEDAADQDPYGTSTEEGFNTEDGRSFYSNEDGTVSEIEDGIVSFDRGGGDSVDSVFGGDTEGEGDVDLNICEPGFEFDPVEGICMPIDTIGDGTGKVKIKDRPVGGDGGGDVTIPVVPRPTTGGVKVRQPSFNKGGVVTRNIDKFANGGVVTPNIDNFFASMR
jgi:hypothetical protein